jgi:phosphoglycerate dehydrogenase-like enzyme
MLVWVPPNATSLLEGPPSGVEIVAIPDDPMSDPRVGEVEFLCAHSGRNRFFPLTLDGFFSKAVSLRVVQTVSAGLDAVIDLVPDEIALCSARGIHDETVAEWVVAAILAGEKSFPLYRDQQTASRWQHLSTRIVAEESIMLLGYGSIGRAVEARLAPIGSKIVRVARRAHPGVAPMTDLDELLPSVDVVVILVPLTRDTLGLVNASFFAKMRPDALLVNAARGKVVDSAALLDALHAGSVRAVLDVTDPEPLPSDSPLYGEPGLFITPHVAADTDRASHRTFELVRAQIERFARGEPLQNRAVDGY